MAMLWAVLLLLIGQVARASPLAGFAQCSRAGLPGTRSTAFCSAVHARGAIMGHALLTRGIARKRVTALRMAQDDDDQENEGAHAEERAIALSNEDSAESKKVKELMARISSTSDAPAPTRLFKALRKPSGAPSLIAEISLDPSYPPSDTGQALSEACRKGKAAAVWVDTAPAGGVALLRTVVREQAGAKGKFPGPVLIVVRERVSHVAQVAQAAALGAAGVVLSADALEVEELKGLLGACCVAGVEAVVEASDGDALGRAGEASARIVCVRGVSSVEEAVELRSSIPKDAVALACVPAMQAGAEEVSEAQALLREGYDGVVLMEAGTEAEHGGYVEWVLGAMTSKKSASFSFGTTGTSGSDNSDSPLTLGAAQEAQRKNPTAWAKAKREAGLIMKDYRGGKRTMKTDKA